MHPQADSSLATGIPPPCCPRSLLIRVHRAPVRAALPEGRLHVCSFSVLSRSPQRLFHTFSQLLEPLPTAPTSGSWRVAGPRSGAGRSGAAPVVALQHKLTLPVPLRVVSAPVKASPFVFLDPPCPPGLLSPLLLQSPLAPLHPGPLTVFLVSPRPDPSLKPRPSSRSPLFLPLPATCFQVFSLTVAVVSPLPVSLSQSGICPQWPPCCQVQQSFLCLHL